MSLLIMRLRTAMVVALPLCATGCSTFLEARRARQAHEREAFFVEMLERGRVYTHELPDGRQVQVLRALIYRRGAEPGAWSILRDTLRDTLVLRPGSRRDIEERMKTRPGTELVLFVPEADWSAFRDPRNLQLRDGWVDPLSTPDYAPRDLYFISLRSLEEKGNPLPTILHGARTGDEAREILRQRHQEFVDTAIFYRDTPVGGAGRAYIACITSPDQPRSSRCIHTGKGYTLIVGSQWGTAAAFPVNAARRSPAVSVAAGLVFFALVFGYTLW